MFQVIAVLVAFVTGVPAVLLALAGLFYWTRSHSILRIRSLADDQAANPVPAPGSQAFVDAIASQINTSLRPANEVELLFDGEATYAALFRDLARARELITFHVFWFRPGDLADELAAILADRARAGVRVLVLRDWYGSLGMDGSYWDELVESGVEARTFRPPRIRAIYKMNQRSHARTVVIDRRIGYTGGFAIADSWKGRGRAPDEWRDTSVRLEGAVVHQLQAAFATSWVEATGELLVGPQVFPDPVAPADGAVAGLFHSEPSLGGTIVERHLALAIRGARERLYISTAYFVPTGTFVDLLADAAKRGVDVRVLHPGSNTDRSATWWAGRRRYERLLEAGVRIYEYAPTMMHAKTLAVDGAWATVGTANFDNRSLALNDEVVLLVQDPTVAGRLERRFLEDLEHACEIDPHRFRGRSAGERARERFWSFFSPLL